ncbi:hypothetical protein [Bacillus sp. JJ1562]|uniref:hypothetical protein n=1 Tax=Bacillus sp. JJ1562 TaxID=3122960 RepID=UPI0030021FB9
MNFPIMIFDLKKKGGIYAITPGYERKITYNNDNQTLERWFFESVSFEQNGNGAEVTVRPLYVDEKGESVKEDDTLNCTK